MSRLGPILFALLLLVLPGRADWRGVDSGQRSPGRLEFRVHAAFGGSFSDRSIANTRRRWGPLGKPRYQFRVNAGLNSGAAQGAIAVGAETLDYGDEPDVNGWYRDNTAHCVGAIKYVFEENTIDDAGRIARREIAGRALNYTYDALGRLTEFEDEEAPENSAQYAYDHMSRRIWEIRPSEVTRFIYEGPNVCLEHLDRDADGDIDRKRVYWLLQGIDKRLGFVDLELDGNGDVISNKAYYYVTDQVGSVLAVYDEAGDAVNRYVYDPFGNLDTERSYEGIDNRYRFQGREYDDYSGHYHYRLRTYLAEYGSFTGPDWAVEMFNPIGQGSYCGLGNNPLRFTDPLGTWEWDGDYLQGLMIMGGEAASSVGRWAKKSVEADIHAYSNLGENIASVSKSGVDVDLAAVGSHMMTPEEGYAKIGRFTVVAVATASAFPSRR